jgi:hypothetical protein
MSKDAIRLSAIVLLGSIGVFSPLGIVALTMTYGPDSEPGMDPPWSLYVIDCLFWIDVASTGVVIGMMQNWRVLTALVAGTLLAVTAVLAFFGGMWVSGNYL